MVATYIGVALYVVLYGGYSLYHRLRAPHVPHFVPLAEVDLDSDAVWERGQGKSIREQERQERAEVILRGGWKAWRARYQQWVD